jgi:hypothetical protein
LTTGNPAPLSYHIHADQKRFDFRIYEGLNYSADFVDLIRSLTQHDAADRPASIDDVLASIERIRGREVPTKETALVPVEEQPLVVPEIKFTEEMRERERNSLTTRKILNTLSYVSYGTVGISFLASGFSLPNMILGVGAVCAFSFLKRLHAGYANPKLQAHARIRELEKIKDTRLYALEAQKHLALTALDEHQLCRRQKKGLARVIKELDDYIAGYLDRKAYAVMDEGERSAQRNLEAKIDFQHLNIKSSSDGFRVGVGLAYSAFAMAIAAAVGIIPYSVGVGLGITEGGALLTLVAYAKSVYYRKKLAKLEREKATLDDKLRHTPMHHTDVFSAEEVAHYNAFMRQVTEDVAALSVDKRAYNRRIEESRRLTAMNPDNSVARLSPENAKIYHDLKSKAEGFQRRLDEYPFKLLYTNYAATAAILGAGVVAESYVIAAIGLVAAAASAVAGGYLISLKRKIRKIDEAALDLLVLERPDAELEEKIAEINALVPAKEDSLYLRVARYVIDKPIHAYYKRRLHAFEEGSYKRLAIIAMRDYTACIDEVRQAFQSNDAELKRLAEEMLDSYETQGDFQATDAYRLRGLISPRADEIELKAMIHQGIPLHSESNTASIHQPVKSEQRLGPKAMKTFQ